MCPCPQLKARKKEKQIAGTSSIFGSTISFLTTLTDSTTQPGWVVVAVYISACGGVEPEAQLATLGAFCDGRLTGPIRFDINKTMGWPPRPGYQIGPL